MIIWALFLTRKWVSLFFFTTRKKKRKKKADTSIKLDDEDRAVGVVHQVVTGGAQDGPLQGPMAAGGNTGHGEGLGLGELDKGLLRGFLCLDDNGAGLDLVVWCG